jgi:type VI secretion system protein ImpL
MRNFFKKVTTTLRKTWVWTLLLVLLIALMVWFIGPLLAVDDYRFWAPQTSRLLTISALSLIWGLSMVFVSSRGARTTPAPGEEKPGATSNQTRFDDRETELQVRFDDALQVVKNSSLYGAQDDRARKQLPWYLVLGAEGSGKTSLLDFSGINFPLNQTGRKLSREQKGTEHCAWYFADKAVIIDSPGRYCQSGEASLEGRDWSVLLKRLRQRRRTQPLNGVLVTLPHNLLVKSAEKELIAYATQMRQRLSELHRTLRVELPVYLVISKADGIDGFDEFFEQMSLEDSQQVFGATFDAQQRGSDVEVVRKEFEAVLQRLNDQLLVRMENARDAQRRAKILAFPHFLSQICGQLCLFIDAAFTGNRYQRASLLRGFYLVRSPNQQEQAVNPGSEQDPASTSATIALFEGRPRFVHDLLNKVIFPEAGLAGIDKNERRRIHWGQRALYGVAASLVAVFIGLWTLSYLANHERLEQVRELASKLKEQNNQLQPQDDALAILSPLNTRFAATQVFPARRDVAWLERSGMYQGEPTNAALDQAYQRELNRLMLPRVARMLEGQIRANLKNRDQLLSSLRAYLMLNLSERRDTPWLKGWMAADWSQRYTGNTKAQTGLNEHFERLLEQPFVYPVNQALITQAREALRSESLANVVYRMLGENTRHLPEYRLAQNLGSGGIALAGTDYKIPGFYTRQGYEQYFLVQGTDTVTEILRDNWVLGEGANLSGMDLRRLIVEVEQLYFRDYANHWSDALGQVSLQPFEGARQAADQMGSLTAANSALVQLLTQVRDNTRLALPTESDAEAAESDDKSAAGTLSGKAAAVAAQAKGALLKGLPDTARKTLERRFEPLHRLLDDKSGPAADLLPAMQALNELQPQMAGLGRSGQGEQAAYELAKVRMGGQRDALSNLRNAATRLPQPLGNWFNGLAEDSWTYVLDQSYQYLNQRYKNDVYSFYGQAIDKRYPFNAHSSSDVEISDFREFFKAQGVAELFFETYLRPFVSGEPGNYRLRSIDGHSLPMSRNTLDQMAKVHVIRKAFFAQSPTEPQVQFKLEPYTLDASVSRAEFTFGNQVMEYRHGPIVPMAFTWPTDAEDGRASLVLEKIIGRAIGIEKNTGAWSLFRLFDLMQTEYLTGREVMVMKADVGGLQANYLLRSQRTPNPFDLGPVRSFRMPVQL